ncbi:DDE-type integrase/transposase/recombinase [Neisseriaceae bacterium PsAf]|nr:DDE-type integrase/transposase/recombinase [Neisseriaceae bacterium PsAf]
MWRLHNTQEKIRVTSLSQMFSVSRPTIYNIIKKARLREFNPRNSTNNHFKSIRYGIKRLAKVEKSIQLKLKAQAKCYNKSYSGEMMHLDTKRLPLLKGQSAKDRREYLFVGINDFSRELYAEIYPDKSQFSAADFLQNNILEQSPYFIDCIYTDNGTEYKGTKDHALVQLCDQQRINQKYTHTARPQTNGKAERVIRTLMEMWHDRIEFTSSEHRKLELNRFINYYNTVKPHASLNKQTPYEVLDFYFKQKV